MRVQIVDSPAYTPPYDRSLCAALARAGVEVELVTSPFAHGSAPAPAGYRVREDFHRRSGRVPPGGPARRPLRLAEHIAGMVRHRRRSVEADLFHYQWLPVPAIDRLLLPSGKPRVLTAHGILRQGAWRGRPSRALRSLLRRMDAVVALSRHGAARLEEAGVPAGRVRVIPHGALDYLTRLPDEAPLPGELATVTGPVVLYFGLVRPYKGVDVLLRAFARIEGAELWVVGRPLGVAMDELRALASRAGGRVRFVSRFVEDREVPAYFRRADLVVFPHRDAEVSGALFAALAFGKPVVASAVGGLREVAEDHGAARLVPPGDPDELAGAITALLADGDARSALAAAAAAAAAGPYSWDEVAAQTLELYRELLG